MISSSDFQAALQILDHLTIANSSGDISNLHFEGEGEKIQPVKIAVYILHLAITEGTEEQKKQLYSRKKDIIALNHLLKSPARLNEVIKAKLGEKQVLPQEENLQGIQIAIPQNKFQRMITTALKIPGFALALISDICLLPAAGVLLLTHALLNVNLNPKAEKIKTDKTPILLLHGSGFCKIQWIAAQQFLKGQEFGSVFSCDFAEGLVTNDPNSSIGDYSADKVRKQIQEIKRLTGQDRIIIIGHSMGSMVGEDYAQRFAKEDGVEVTNVLSISTPWQGSPTIDLLKLKDKRYQEMSQESGAAEHVQFRQRLILNAKKAEQRGHRLQWNMWSKHDFAVPGRTGRLTEDPRRHYEVSGVGHYGPMFSFRMLRKMRSWVKEMYRMERAQNSKLPVPSDDTLVMQPA